MKYSAGVCTGAGIQWQVTQSHTRPISAFHQWLRNRAGSRGPGFAHLYLLLYCCHPLQGLATLTFQEPNGHLLSKYLSNTCEPGTVVGTNGGLIDSATEGLRVYWDLGREQGDGHPSFRNGHSIQTSSSRGMEAPTYKTMSHHLCSSHSFLYFKWSIKRKNSYSCEWLNGRLSVNVISRSSWSKFSTIHKYDVSIMNIVSNRKIKSSFKHDFLLCLISLILQTKKMTFM